MVLMDISKWNMELFFKGFWNRRNWQSETENKQFLEIETLSKEKKYSYSKEFELYNGEKSVQKLPVSSS